MDEMTGTLKEDLDQLLREAAEVSVALESQYRFRNTGPDAITLP
jgi:hypothetical protein